MPYTITTRTPVTHADTTYVRTPSGAMHYDKTRRAVATLEEARKAVVTSLVEDLDLPERLLDDAEELPESGGTIGLPDGTVIEVAICDWTDLIQAALDADGAPPLITDTDVDRAEIIDAYNAAQTTSVR